VPSEFSWPPLRAMKDADDFDRVPPDPVRNYEWRSRDDKFARSVDPPRPSDIRIRFKQFDRIPNAGDDLGGRPRIIFAYVGADLIDVS
jgi:hypothetical protein